MKYVIALLALVIVTTNAAPQYYNYPAPSFAYQVTPVHYPRPYQVAPGQVVPAPYAAAPIQYAAAPSYAAPVAPVQSVASPTASPALAAAELEGVPKSALNQCLDFSSSVGIQALSLLSTVDFSGPKPGSPLSKLSPQQQAELKNKCAPLIGFSSNILGKIAA